MALIKWDSSCNVNVEIIDKQHQLLVKMINELYDAMSAGKGKDEVGKIINRLILYAGMHFAREEYYFDIFGYPEIELHQKEHDDFEQEVSKFETDFNEGRQTLSMEIINFLSNWLLGHIKESDKKFGPFFNERGLK